MHQLMGYIDTIQFFVKTEKLSMTSLIEFGGGKIILFILKLEIPTTLTKLKY